MNNNQAFILNLPSEIIIHILTRLPIQSMISCKCVCKKWLQLFSNPDFSKFNLSKPTPGLIVQLTQNEETFCKIVEFEDILDLQNHNLHYKPVLKFDPSSFTSSDFTTILCSVNGLICFHEYINELDAFYICNPITREYITLPQPNGNTLYPNYIVTYGLGVSSVTSQYKVVRIFHEPLDSNLRNLKVECIVYTLGTGSWRSIEPGEPYEYDTRPSIGAFLNGNLHWLVYDSDDVMLILCLDLETELFKPFSRAPFLRVGGSLTSLEDCYLCFCDYGSDEEIVIWIMKEYGVEDSWTKEVVINKYPDLGGIIYEAVYVLKVFKDGEILMLWENTCLFYYCDKTKSAPKVDLFKPDGYGYINVLPHTSSFVSLGIFALENIGFCSEGRHRLLVYEFLKNGSLDSFLFTSKESKAKKVLNWEHRYGIALGTAKGITYLHEECRDCILHCDIKPENILLDETYNARISDFGLAKLLNLNIISNGI